VHIALQGRKDLDLEEELKEKMSVVTEKIVWEKDLFPAAH